VLNGVLNIDKPGGMTSHDVVARVRRVAKQKKVGHAGTLDPDATGVLLVCLGASTRLCDLLASQGKSYVAGFSLGVTSSTEDISGETLSETNAGWLAEGDLRTLLPRFVGQIEQIPPMVSAVHHNGQRLYDLARQGITVERQARTIEIESIELLHFEPDDTKPTARIEVRCGKGTYIRTLCADIGSALNVGGRMDSLVRRSVGNFALGDKTSVSLEALEADGAEAHLVAPADALSFLHAVTISQNEIADLFNGKDLMLKEPLAPETIIKLLHEETGALLALAVVSPTGKTAHPDKVFKGE
jgi:tRNA pseudouridine55 synthase